MSLVLNASRLVSKLPVEWIDDFLHAFVLRLPSDLFQIESSVRQAVEDGPSIPQALRCAAFVMDVIPPPPPA